MPFLPSDWPFSCQVFDHALVMEFNLGLKQQQQSHVDSSLPATRTNNSTSASLRDALASQPSLVNILNELRSFCVEFGLKLDQLTVQLYSCICAVETALFAAQFDIVALADVLLYWSRAFLKLSPVSVAWPSASTFSNISCHSARAGGSLASVILANVLYELRL